MSETTGLINGRDKSIALNSSRRDSKGLSDTDLELIILFSSFIYPLILSDNNVCFDLWIS